MASTLAFAYDQSPPDARTLTLVCVVLGVSVFAAQAWRKSPVGCLCWDGLQWNWSGFVPSQECGLSLRLDFQSVLLVCLSAQAHRPVYLWLEAATDMAAWNALRRAIVGSQRFLAGDGDGLQPDAGGGAA